MYTSRYNALDEGNIPLQSLKIAVLLFKYSISVLLDSWRVTELFRITMVEDTAQVELCFHP